VKPEAKKTDAHADGKKDGKPEGKAAADSKDGKGEGKASASSTQKGEGSSASKTAAKVNNPFADDLLADLNSSNATHKPNAKASQAGAPGGAAQSAGAANAAKSNHGEYIGLVVARVRPHVQVPDNVSGNPKAVVEVTLLPSLEVRDVKLLQSSGNPAYDEAVQRAVWTAKTFPPLPSGAQFADFRRLKLEFRPR
jgi:colicin import membrane protein